MQLSKIKELDYHTGFVKQVKCSKDFLFSVSCDRKIGILGLTSMSKESLISLNPFSRWIIKKKENVYAYGRSNILAIWSLNEKEFLLKGHGGKIQAIYFYPKSK